MQPINPAFKCVEIFFLPEKNCKANDIFIELARDISDILTNNGFIVVVIATDGDNAYDKKAIEMFSICLKDLSEGGIDALNKCIDCIDKFDGSFLISDMLHLLKLTRKSTLSNCICVDYQNLEHSFTARHLSLILKIGKALTDMTTTGKMRDSYAKLLFNITSLMKLVNKGEFEALAFFLPYSLWSEAIFKEGIDTDSRCYLLSVSFHAFFVFMFKV